MSFEEQVVVRTLTKATHASAYLPAYSIRTAVTCCASCSLDYARSRHIIHISRLSYYNSATRLLGSSICHVACHHLTGCQYAESLMYAHPFLPRQKTSIFDLAGTRPSAGCSVLAAHVYSFFFFCIYLISYL